MSSEPVSCVSRLRYAGTKTIVTGAHDAIRVCVCCVSASRYDVEVAGTGEQAVELFKQGEFDIVLMDIQLPGIDGIEATKIIRTFEQSHDRKPSVIFGLTGNVADENIKV